MADAGRDVAGWIARLTSGAALDHALALPFDAIAIRVRSNSAELIERLRCYYRGFFASDRQRGSASAGPGAVEVEPVEVLAVDGPAPTIDISLTPRAPDAGKRRIKEEYLELRDGRLVRKRLTGMCFVFGSGRHLAAGPCAANYNQIVNFINNRCIEAVLHRGGLLCHAAGVALRGRGLAIAAQSGMGKSTLALHLLRRGLDFVSNDRLLVRPDDAGPFGASPSDAGTTATMYGVPKLPRVNPGTILNNPDLHSIIPEARRRELAALPRETLWQLEEKYDVDIDACFGRGRFALKSRMAGLVFINWSRTPGAPSLRAITPADRPDLIDVLAKALGLFVAEPNTDPGGVAPRGRYVEYLRGSPTYEITGGADFDRAADACVRLLEGSGND